METDVVSERLISVASPALGSAANCYWSLVNLEEDDDDDVSMIQIGTTTTRDSPGNGAISPYYGREFFAASDIQVGQELFVK